MAVWIELDFTRRDFGDVNEAKQSLRQLWPDAVFSDPIEIDGTQQTAIHVREKPLGDHEAMRGPDAVIIQEE